MDWDDFRYFMAAAETGSLTAAAKRLRASQPTVGRRIDALETTLGIKLFQRSVNGLMLTEEGAFVFEHAQAMYAAAEKIRRNVEREDKRVGGTVRLALPEGLCSEIFAPALPRFYREHPGIYLILNVSSNTANLTRGEADIAVRLFRPKENNLVTRRLGTMTLGLFASTAYLKAHGQPVNIPSLKRHRVIAYGDQLSALPENQWLLRHSAPSACVLSSDNTITHLRATAAGVGISVQPHLICRGNPGMVPVLKNARLPHHEVWIAYHNDLRHLAGIRTVVDFISSTLDPGFV